MSARLPVPEDVQRLLGDNAIYCTSSDHIGEPVWHHKDFHGESRGPDGVKHWCPSGDGDRCIICSRPAYRGEVTP